MKNHFPSNLRLLNKKDLFQMETDPFESGQSRTAAERETGFHSLIQVCTGLIQSVTKMEMALFFIL